MHEFLGAGRRVKITNPAHLSRNQSSSLTSSNWDSAVSLSLGLSVGVDPGTARQFT